MTVRVLVGDALSVLRTLPAESVQCVVTSPPYFGLRAYGTDPQVWGGDDHEHEWGDTQRAPGWVSKNGQGATSLQDHGDDGKSPYLDQVHGETKQKSGGAFCSCGAWRGELGSEPTPALFIEHLVSIFDEVWRVLRPDGLCFVNLGDSHSGSGKGPTGRNGIGNAFERQGFGNDERNEMRRGAGTRLGIPAKNLLLVPQRFAIAMQERGWIVRSEIVWAKTSAMPESVRDRPTSAWEPIWMFSKSQRYFYDGDAVRQPASSFGRQHTTGIQSPKVRAYAEATGQGRHGGDLSINYERESANLRNVWTLGPSPFADAHFATFPPEIPRRAILAGTSEKGACPACGAPWVRISKPTAEYQATLDRLKSDPAWKGARRAEAIAIGNAFGSRATREPAGYQTLGWQPGCSCPPATTVPCVVLDPFLGSGTTALVADRLGRDAIGIELSQSYAEMARKRIEQDAGNLFGDVVSVEAPAQLDLFGEVAG